MNGPLTIDISSLPTLMRRVRKELPGITIEVTLSAREGKVVVRSGIQHGNIVRGEFEKLVSSL